MPSQFYKENLFQGGFHNVSRPRKIIVLNRKSGASVWHIEGETVYSLVMQSTTGDVTNDKDVRLTTMTQGNATIEPHVWARPVYIVMFANDLARQLRMLPSAASVGMAADVLEAVMWCYMTQEQRIELKKAMVLKPMFVPKKFELDPEGFAVRKQYGLGIIPKLIENEVRRFCGFPVR